MDRKFKIHFSFLLVEGKTVIQTNMVIMWDNLVRWVEEHGGFVHKSLDLRNVTTLNNHNRGLFTSRTISQGDILLKLPRTSTTINGESMLSMYQITDDSNHTTCTRTVSSWLRCLAALINAMKNNRNVPYMESLPTTYETLWQWNENEIDIFLAGTRPMLNKEEQADEDNISSEPTSASSLWMIDPMRMRQQYDTNIRPFLTKCGIIPDSDKTCIDSSTDEEFQRFMIACQIISTRSFYMDDDSCSDNNANDTRNLDHMNRYTGPYLIPIIDLINHADTITGSTNTKLELLPDENGMFAMRALDDIPPNTEILHSYGDHLSCYQFLSSFGCIPMNRIQRPLQHTELDIRTVSTTYLRSVILTKQQIWDSCWYLIESGFPLQLQSAMEESLSLLEDDDDEVEAETWNITLDKNRKADCVPDDILICAPSTGANEIDINDTQQLSNILSDELVTVACIPFLPKCAYAEITSRTLLDCSIIKDYFLGQLVCAAILRTIQQRLFLYQPIEDSVVRRLLPSFQNTSSSTNTIDDIALLRTLLPLIQESEDGSSLDIERRRLAYGQTIRLEEKEVLKLLGTIVVSLINSLNIEYNHHNNVDEQANNEPFEDNMIVKKYKVNDD
jgi:hypothetical protein